MFTVHKEEVKKNNLKTLLWAYGSVVLITVDTWRKICSTLAGFALLKKTAKGSIQVQNAVTEIFLFPICDATVCIQLKDNLSDYLYLKANNLCPCA